MSQANKVVGLRDAQNKFERNFKDVIALISGGPEELWTRLAAELVMHPTLNDEVEEYLQKWIDTPGEYKLAAYGALVNARYRLLATLFTRLRDREAFDFAVPATDESLAQMDELDVVAGLRLPAPPLPPPKSSADLLESQVIADHAALPSDKFRAKLSGNRVYAEAFNRLSETGAINSRITQLHDGVGG